MNETPKALQAWNDYLELGPDRSLEKLLDIYRNRDHPPTKHLPTLKNWSRWHGWQARLAEIAEQERLAIVAQGIANKQNRVNAADVRHRLLEQVRTERAEDPTMQAVPGGKTGLLVRTYKSIGAGPSALCMEEYAVDTSMLKEMREHEKQVAMELGQWKDGEADGSRLVRQYVGVDVDAV